MAILILKKATLALFAFVLCLVLGGARAQDTPSEYQVKAAFLFNFAKFVEWPDAAFPAPNSSFIIGVLGDDPFGPALDKAVEGKTLNDRKIVVRRFDQAGEVKGCQMLFISRSEQKNLGKILEHLGKSNTLMVSEMPQMLARGGMINFLIEEHKVRFDINPDAAERAGLKISSKLLQLAHAVKGSHSGGSG